MSEQIKGFWLKNLLKGKVWILGALVLILNVACGGGGGGDNTNTYLKISILLHFM